jgi:hypothetical protein
VKLAQQPSGGTGTEAVSDTEVVHRRTELVRARLRDVGAGVATASVIVQAILRDALYRCPRRAAAARAASA